MKKTCYTSEHGLREASINSEALNQRTITVRPVSPQINHQEIVDDGIKTTGMTFVLDY